MTESKPNVRIVLCHPQGSRNVGAACRAMKTMGIEDLVIVGEREDHDVDQVRMTALHAFDVYQACRYCHRLEDALRDVVLSAGVTRRLGSRRKLLHCLPEDLANRVATSVGRVAAVFGTERTGLTDTELEDCDIAVRIPSSPAFPSLNLSHAVQIIAYAIHRERHTEPAPPIIDRERLNAVVGTLIMSLKTMNYFKLVDGSYTARLFRDILARAGLHEEEANRMESLFRNLPYFGSGQETAADD